MSRGIPELAATALAQRGIADPTTQLVRLEMLRQHLDEAACLAAMLGERDLERAISVPSEAARTLQQVEATERRPPPLVSRRLRGP